MIAAADGEVYQIKQGSGGYGRAIYMRHKGKFITLYGHLSAFAPSIREHVEKKVRKTGKFGVKLRLSKPLSFKAGEVIGWSGTSGTDLQHLHFELRYKNGPINPLTHGLSLPDRQAPTILSLFADPLDEKARIEGGVSPKQYIFQRRPAPSEPLATSLFASSEQAQINPIAHPKRPIIHSWGHVGLSVEVEDRIDGSLRELTPHEIKLFIDDRLVHHLHYQSTSYSDHRSSSLDFDVERRGQDRHLVHRLYRYGPPLRVLKRGSTHPLKRLKRGVHIARIEASDAAGNQSQVEFELHVAPPVDPPCELKKRRLKYDRRAEQLWRPQEEASPKVTWREAGLSFTLPMPCLSGDQLEAELWINQRRAPNQTLSLSRIEDQPALNIHLDKIEWDKWIEQPEAPQKEALLDRSLDLAMALQVKSSRSVKDKTTAPQVYRYQLRVHEVRGGVTFKASGVEVKVGEASPFTPYLTAAASLAPLTASEEWTQVDQTIEFAQPWRPMKSPNEVRMLVPSRQRGQHVGAYLLEGERRWWVSLAWERDWLSASSTHLAKFALFRDSSPPQIGEFKWDLQEPLGPRMVVPISDSGSGLSRVKLFIDEVEMPIEVQQSWSRLLYHPATTPTEGTHRYEVQLKDRAGHVTQRSGTFLWPPPDAEQLPKNDPARRWLLPPP